MINIHNKRRLCTMSNIREKKNKNGETISFEIRVYKGRDNTGKQLKPYTMTWKPSPNMTAKQIEKELNQQATLFEEQCKTGYIQDNKQTFAQYAEYVLALKERTGTKHKTIELYHILLRRINEGIGHFKLTDIKPQHLNNLYEQLSKAGLRGNSEKAISKSDLKDKIKSAGLTFEKLSKASGVSENTISKACKGEVISLTKAQAIAKTLNISVTSMFKIKTDNTPLSNKTIVEHHRLISTIMTQAEKEMLILFNPARKASPPKIEQHQANYFQIEDVEAIRDSLENEPLKWKTIIHLLLITGARRGEIAGLKWNVIDWKNNQIHITNNLLYTSDRGLYEDSTKTESSDRYVKLPQETMLLLKQYRKWFMEQVYIYGDKFQNTGFIFFQEKEGNVGKPMHPDSITDWCNKFSIKYNLPHINPHAFRHTMASILYFNGADSISISKRLGHSKVSTTTDIYSHIIKQADEQSAECIADVFLRKNTKQA